MMVDLYTTRKTNVQVEALCLTAENVFELTVWCGGVSVVEHDALEHTKTFAAINVPTAFGMMRAQEDDWIIKRPAGDFYPVKPGRFNFLFELVK